MPKKKRVVVVDDDTDVADGLHLFIENTLEGVFVTVTVSGEAAIALLRSEEVHALVCDPQVRTMDAAAFLRRARLERPDVPQIITTVHRGDEARSLAEEVGADAVLGKPFEPAQLTEVLARVLKLDPAPRAGASPAAAAPTEARGPGPSPAGPRAPPVDREGRGPK